MSPATDDFDVIIVGARCAGSPIATTLARHGLRVVVLEQATTSRPTLSSHMLQADSLNFLNRLGVLPQVAATGATVMTRTDTRLDDLRFVADFPQGPGDAGGAVCIRRHLLDPILSDAAIAAGADVRTSTRVRRLLWEDGRVSGVEAEHRGRSYRLRARLVIGADGRHSTVAEQTGARRYNLVENERWYYWTYYEGADLGPEPTFVFHRWGDRHIFAGPADSGLYILGISPENPEREAFRQDLDRSMTAYGNSCEPVAQALAEAGRAEKIYGITRFTGYFREPSGPGWVLLGDSGHFKDPAAGRGIGDAFDQGTMLASVVLAGITRPAAELDRMVAEWGRWRDRKYHEHYWLAGVLGQDGPLPEILPAVARTMHQNGEIGRFLSLYGHRTTPAEILTPGRIARTTVRLLTTPGTDRRTVLSQVAGAVRQDRRQRKLARRPLFEETGPNNETLARERPQTRRTDHGDPTREAGGQTSSRKNSDRGEPARETGPRTSSNTIMTGGNP